MDRASGATLHVHLVTLEEARPDKAKKYHVDFIQ